jgi:hypothetical protein
MVAGDYNQAGIYPSEFGILHNNNVSLKHLLCGEPLRKVRAWFGQQLGGLV